MSARTTPIVPNGTEQTRRRLERWRETRTAGMPMPEELWAAPRSWRSGTACIPPLAR